MGRSTQALHGIEYTADYGWRVWSHLLQFPVQCGSPSDAKRIALALEAKFSLGSPVDYTEVDAAIAAKCQPQSLTV